MSDSNRIQNALATAARAGDSEAVAAALNQGADPKAKDPATGRSAVFESGSLEVAKLLASTGADTNEKDVFGFDPLDFALRNGSLDIAEYLIEQGAALEEEEDGWKRIHRQALMPNLDSLKFLMEKGVSANSVTSKGLTVLHVLAWQGPSDEEEEAQIVASIDHFVALGQSIDARDLYLQTPLHKAVSGDWPSPAAAEALIRHGCKLDVTDANGQTALHLAAQTKTSECVKQLLAAGADSGIKDDAGNDALFHAEENLADSCGKFESSKGIPKEELEMLREDLDEAEEIVRLLKAQQRPIETP